MEKRSRWSLPTRTQSQPKEKEWRAEGDRSLPALQLRCGAGHFQRLVDRSASITVTDAQHRTGPVIWHWRIFLARNPVEWVQASGFGC
jgi:hypothetical protein